MISKLYFNGYFKKLMFHDKLVTNWLFIKDHLRNGITDNQRIFFFFLNRHLSLFLLILDRGREEGREGKVGKET